MTAEHSMRHLIALTWMALFATAAGAEQSRPPAEFWDYLLEFADSKARVIDPADYALISNLPNGGRQDDDALPRANEDMDSSSATTPQRIRNDVGDAVEETP